MESAVEFLLVSMLRWFSSCCVALVSMVAVMNLWRLGCSYESVGNGGDVVAASVVESMAESANVCGSKKRWQSISKWRCQES